MKRTIIYLGESPVFVQASSPCVHFVPSVDEVPNELGLVHQEITAVPAPSRYVVRGDGKLHELHNLIKLNQVLPNSLPSLDVISKTDLLQTAGNMVVGMAKLRANKPSNTPEE